MKVNLKTGTSVLISLDGPKNILLIWGSCLLNSLETPPRFGFLNAQGLGHLRPIRVYCGSLYTICSSPALEFRASWTLLFKIIRMVSATCWVSTS